MKLFSYWRSSCSWRVRIALAHKQLPFEIVAVNLLNDEQKADSHLSRNAMGQVPVLEIDGKLLAQSVAICEYLDERFPERPLLPKDVWARAQTRAIVEEVNSGIQPLQNLSVGRFVAATFNSDAKVFHAHFVGLGVKALEATVAQTAGRYCVGDSVTLADAFLVPQLYGARRFGVTLEACPTLLRIEAELQKLDAFTTTHPDRHPGATT